MTKTPYVPPPPLDPEQLRKLADAYRRFNEAIEAHDLQQAEREKRNR